MKNFYFFYLLLLIFIIGISCSKLEDYSNNQKVVIKLDQLTDELIEQKKIPGLIISISAPQKGLFYQKAKGFADLSTLKPMTSDCLYRTGSFTKTFTGAIMLIALECFGSILQIEPDYPGVIEASNDRFNQND